MLDESQNNKIGDLKFDVIHVPMAIPVVILLFISKRKSCFYR